MYIWRLPIPYTVAHMYAEVCQQPACQRIIVRAVCTFSSKTGNIRTFTGPFFRTRLETRKERKQDDSAFFGIEGSGLRASSSSCPPQHYREGYRRIRIRIGQQ